MVKNQLDILEKMLIEKGIRYTRIDDPGQNTEGAVVGEFHQIQVRNLGYEWDVICQPGSYGYEEGLLEFQDGVEEDVIGYLTAEQVIKIVESKEYRMGYRDATINIRNSVAANLNKGWWKRVFGTES